MWSDKLAVVFVAVFQTCEFQSALWWRNYATSTLMTWLKGVSPISPYIFKFTFYFHSLAIINADTIWHIANVGMIMNMSGYYQESCLSVCCCFFNCIELLFLVFDFTEHLSVIIYLTSHLIHLKVSECTPRYWMIQWWRPSIFLRALLCFDRKTMWRNYIYIFILFLSFLMLLQSFFLILYCLFTTCLLWHCSWFWMTKRWGLDYNVLVEFHNRLLMLHVKCRGAYLLRLFDILDICTRISDVYFFFQGDAYIRGVLRWKPRLPGSWANRGGKCQIGLFIAFHSPLHCLAAKQRTFIVKSIMVIKHLISCDLTRIKVYFPNSFTFGFFELSKFPS